MPNGGRFARQVSADTAEEGALHSSSPSVSPPSASSGILIRESECEFDVAAGRQYLALDPTVGGFPVPSHHDPVYYNRCTGFDLLLTGRGGIPRILVKNDFSSSSVSLEKTTISS